MQSIRKNLKFIFFKIVIIIAIIMFFNNANSYAKTELLGDINLDAKVDITDILKMLRHISATKTKNKPEWILAGENLKKADVDENGKIDITDLLHVLRYTAAIKNENVKEMHPEWINKLEREIEDLPIEGEEQKHEQQPQNPSEEQQPSNPQEQEQPSSPQEPGTEEVTRPEEIENPQEPEIIQVQQVILDKQELLFDISENISAKINCTITPNNANTGTKITWRSSNEAVATVTENGTITAKANGETNIIATSENGKTASCKVTVRTSQVEPEQIPLQQIILDKQEIVLDTTSNASAKINATLSPNNANSGTGLTWKSSNEAVATVTGNGTVTAKANGVVNISVTSENGRIASCRVLVQTSPSGIKINETNIELNTVLNKTKQLTYTILPSTANVNKQVSWKSSNESVATVNEQGLVTVIKEGTCIITASTQNGKTSTSNVNIQNSLQNIEISQQPNKLKYQYGEELDTAGLKVNAVYSNGTKIDVTNNVTISGYNKNQIGNQTINVTYEGKSTAFVVNVVDYTTKISVTSMPTKTSYEYGYTISSDPETGDIKLDRTGMIITATMASGTTKNVTQDCILTGYQNLPSRLEQTIKVTYKDAVTNKNYYAYFDITMTVGKNYVAEQTYRTVKDVKMNCSNNELGKLSLKYNNAKLDGDYRTAQGFCRVKINGVYYYFCAVHGKEYDASGNETENSDLINTYMYVLDSECNTVAVIGDRSYGHANSFTYDEKNGYIYTIYNKIDDTRVIGKINQQIITDAINKVKNQESKLIIEKNWSDKYITEYRVMRTVSGGGKNISMLAYRTEYEDSTGNKHVGQLFGCKSSSDGTETICKIQLDDTYNSTIIEDICTLRIYSKEEKNGGASSGFAMHRNYVILGKYVDDGVAYYGECIEYSRNFIDAYRLTVDSKDNVTANKYLGSYALDIMDELEDIEYINANTLIVYVNKLWGRGWNNLYKLTLNTPINLLDN